MSSNGDESGVRFGDSANISGSAIAGAGSVIQFNQQQDGPALTSLDEVRAALSTLIDQLRASPAGVEDPGALAEVAVSVQQEVDKEKPNKHILTGLLHGLMVGVQKSAQLASAVLAIQQAVGLLL
jgi:hypothetical protein